MKASFKTHILFRIWNQRVHPRFIYTHRRSRAHIILIDARWEMYLTSSFLSGYKRRAHEAQSSSAAAMEHGPPGAGHTMAPGHGETWGRSLSGPSGTRLSQRSSAHGATSSGCLWTSGGGSSCDWFPSHVSRCFSCGWEEDIAHGTALEDAAQPHLQEGSVGELGGGAAHFPPRLPFPSPSCPSPFITQTAGQWETSTDRYVCEQLSPKTGSNHMSIPHSIKHYDFLLLLTPRKIFNDSNLQ